jgi:hypothetical protein
VPPGFVKNLGSLTEHRKTRVVSGRLRSVDDWPLAKISYQISGGKPRPVTVDSST